MSPNFKPSSLTPLQMTTVLIAFLHCLQITHMLPMSSPLRTDVEFLIDPILQSEADEDGILEAKRVVPKSVFNTVIRVTNSPCLPGMERVKEGGPCVTKYSSSGPVLDEEFQLSILKGITSLGGITRRPNRNRNRHRKTTTTAMPPTITPTMDTPTTDFNPFAVEEGAPPHDKTKTAGNTEITDIEVESIPEVISPIPESASIHEEPTTVSSIVPTPVPETVSAPIPPNVTEPEPEHHTSMENGSSSTSTLSLFNSSVFQIQNQTVDDTLQTDGETTPFAGIKVDENGKTEPSTGVDFPTTMISKINGDEVINVSFNGTEEADGDEGSQWEIETATEPMTPKTEDEEQAQVDQDSNVMANQSTTGPGDDNSFEGDLLMNFTQSDTLPSHPDIDAAATTEFSDFLEPELEGSDNLKSETVTSLSNGTLRLEEEDLISNASDTQSEEELLNSVPANANNIISPKIPTPTPLRFTFSEMSSSPVPVTNPVIGVKETENENASDFNFNPVVITSVTPLNFTEGENDTLMTDRNTRLPDEEVFLQTNPRVERNDSKEFEPLSISISPSKMPKIQVDDFEMEPQDEPDSSETDDNEDFDPLKIQPEHPSMDKTPTSFTQQILAQLHPVPISSEEIFSSRQRSDIHPDQVMNMDTGTGSQEILFPNDDKLSQEEDIEQIHHRSRNREKMDSSEESDVLDLSLPTPTKKEESSRGRSSSNDNEASLPAIIHGSFPNFFFGHRNWGNNAPVEYDRLGNNYRRFRVF